MLRSVVADVSFEVQTDELTLRRTNDQDVWSVGVPPCSLLLGCLQLAGWPVMVHWAR